MTWVFLPTAPDGGCPLAKISDLVQVSDLRKVEQRLWKAWSRAWAVWSVLARTPPWASTPDDLQMIGGAKYLLNATIEGVR